MPVLFIITGSNGAGKSSLGASYLPPELKKQQIFDGDKLASSKSIEFYATVKSWKEAKRNADSWLQKYFLKQVNSAINAKQHFAYEGHFRNIETLKIPRKFKRNGYRLNLIFMGLIDPDQSELRVLESKHPTTTIFLNCLIIPSFA